MSRMSLPAQERAAARGRLPWLVLIPLSLLVLASCGNLLRPSAELSVVVPPSGQGPGGGRFIVQCNGPIKSAAFDPIVYPGQATAGHNHEFYGNRTISPNSTYASLAGKATGCDDQGDSAAYWHPTVYSHGVRKAAPKSTFYYDSPLSGPVRTFPSGLKMVAGNHAATKPQNTHIVYWGCGSGSSSSGMSTPPQCQGGDLTVHVIFPNCWDGRHLDTADHQSHLAYGRDACPSTHPVALPRLIMRIQFNGWRPDPRSLTLSSGSINSMHADFFQAWVPSTLSKAVAVCINGGKDCSADTVLGL